MQLKHSFTVPAGIEQAWQVLLDIERIAPCMPGAALDTVDGDDFTGSVKVRLGPIGLTYRGKASFVEKDAATHRAVIDAQGKDARGNGTAKATIMATLTEDGGATAVDVVTDLNITGKPAQFGRGVMVDVGNKLIGRFADCLAGKLTGPDATEPDADPALVDPGVVQLTAGEPGIAEPAAAALAETEAVDGGTDVAEPAAVPGAGLPDTAVGVAEPAPAEPDTPVGGMGMTQPIPAESPAAGPVTPAVVSLPGAALDDEVAVEPAAAEAAPAARRVPGLGVAPVPAVQASPTVQTSPQPPRGPSPVPPRPVHRPSSDEVEPIDLLGSAGPALAKRLAPVAAGALVVLALLLNRRAHRRRVADRRAADRRPTGRRLTDRRAADRRAADRRAADRRVSGGRATGSGTRRVAGVILRRSPAIMAARTMLALVRRRGA